MREIKFRVKIKEDAKTWKAYIIDFSNLKILIKVIASYDWISFDNVEVFLQYIGCKDKNGNEIYEGNIIKTYYSWMYNAIGVVEYVQADAGFYIVFNKNKRSLIRGNQCEIIGNIYENPELLNGK